MNGNTNFSFYYGFRSFRYAEARCSKCPVYLIISILTSSSTLMGADAVPFLTLIPLSLWWSSNLLCLIGNSALSSLIFSACSSISKRRS